MMFDVIYGVVCDIGCKYEYTIVEKGAGIVILRRPPMANSISRLATLVYAYVYECHVNLYCDDLAAFVHLSDPDCFDAIDKFFIEANDRFCSRDMDL